MKNGFTLIEVLAVLLILTGITLIIVPIMNKTVKDAENKVNSQNEKNIILGTKNWASDNKDKLPKDNKKYVITAKTLKKEGYIDFDKGCIVITNKEKAYYYKYKEEC